MTLSTRDTIGIEAQIFAYSKEAGRKGRLLLKSMQQALQGHADCYGTLTEFLEKGTTVNCARYVQTLQNLRKRIRRVLWQNSTGKRIIAARQCDIANEQRDSLDN